MINGSHDTAFAVYFKNNYKAYKYAFMFVGLQRETIFVTSCSLPLMMKSFQNADLLL